MLQDHLIIQSLDGKCWLSSEVLDGAFEFMSSKLKCVGSFSYITMEPYATESFNSNYLQEKMSEHTNILIIPILEKILLVLHCLLIKWESHQLPGFYVSRNKTQILPENAANNIPTFSSCKYWRMGFDITWQSVAPDWWI